MRLRLRRQVDLPECLLSVFISPSAVCVGGGHTLRKYTTIRKPSNHIECTCFCVNVCADTRVSACMCMDEEAMWLSQKPANLQPGKADADGGQESADNKAQMKGHRRM